MIVAGTDHPLVGRSALTLDDIAQETMIVREAGSGTRLAMEGFFREHAIEPNIDMEMGSNEAIKQAVVAGLGISFISQHTLGLELSAGRLVAAGRGYAGDAPLVPRAPQEQAPDAGARCLLGFRPRIRARLPQASRASGCGR